MLFTSSIKKLFFMLSLVTMSTLRLSRSWSAKYKSHKFSPLTTGSDSSPGSIRKSTSLSSLKFYPYLYKNTTFANTLVNDEENITLFIDNKLIMNFKRHSRDHIELLYIFDILSFYI